MLSESYLKTIKLNNIGCEYLEGGNLYKSRDCFRLALKSMTETIVKAQQKEAHQLNAIDTGMRFSNFQWSALPRTPFNIPSETFLYQRAILIHRSDIARAGLCPSTFELSDESSMIVYNLGLVVHLIGITTNHLSLLNEAMSFYQIAQAIRASKNSQKCFQKLIDIALYNNMGQIEHEHVNYDRARMFFCRLRDAMMVFCRDGLVTLLSQNDCDGFILNASMHEVTLAAAA